MTRINCIDPKLLRTKHLVAEYRELPRIFGLIHKAIVRGEHPQDSRNPSAYTLGKGHVRFFYNKAQFLVKRQKQLVEECQRRNINVQFTDVDSLVENIPTEWYNDWDPPIEAIYTNLMRINERGGLIAQVL